MSAASMPDVRRLNVQCPPGQCPMSAAPVPTAFRFSAFEHPASPEHDVSSMCQDASSFARRVFAQWTSQRPSET
eukprot:7110431-Alexandrium_andersonii.AAC.1